MVWAALLCACEDRSRQAPAEAAESVLMFREESVRAWDGPARAERETCKWRGTGPWICHSALMVLQYTPNLLEASSKDVFKLSRVLFCFVFLFFVLFCFVLLCFFL